MPFIRFIRNTLIYYLYNIFAIVKVILGCGPLETSLPKKVIFDMIKPPTETSRDPDVLFFSLE